MKLQDLLQSNAKPIQSPLIASLTTGEAPPKDTSSKDKAKAQKEELKAGEKEKGKEETKQKISDLVAKEIEKVRAEMEEKIQGLMQEIETKKEDFKKEMEVMSPLEVIKGAKGDKPTTEELTGLIQPLIPEPIKGDKGDSIVGPPGKSIRGLPGRKGNEGKTPLAGLDYPSEEQFRKMIKEMFPKVIDEKEIKVLIEKAKKITVSKTAPKNPKLHDLWIDIN